MRLQSPVLEGWTAVDLESTAMVAGNAPVSAGKGLAGVPDRHEIGDRGRFVYQIVNDERAEIIVKISGLTIEPVDPEEPVSPLRGQVGVMIRDGLDSEDRMVAVAWERNGFTDETLLKNSFHVSWREGLSENDVFGFQHDSAQNAELGTWADPGPDPDPNTDPPASFYAPIWLKLQRSGNGVGVSRSLDGVSWSPAWAPHAGADFFPTGPVYVGVFVASYDPPNDAPGGNGPTITTAHIEEVTVREGDDVQFEHRTSWLGGTDNGALASHSPGLLSSLYVAPDGRAYSFGPPSEWNLVRRQILDAEAGRILQPSFRFNPGLTRAPNVLAGDGTYVYFVRSDETTFCVDRLKAGDLAPAAPTNVEQHGSCPVADRVAGAPAGVAAHVSAMGLRVYVTDFANGLVHTFGEPATGSGRLAYLSNFSVDDHPSAVVVDKRGKVWVVHSATAYGQVGSYDLVATPSIKGYDPATGTAFASIPACSAATPRCPTLQQAAGACVVNPTALAYDGFGERDRLLVGENGSSQNVHIFCNLAGNPSRCGPGEPSSFGQEGGVLCGSSPGKVTDGGADRFHAIAGLGVSEDGSIYVADAAPYFSVRKYAPSGTQLWANRGLAINLPAFDPDADGLHLYSDRYHFKLNLGDGNAPGDEARRIDSPDYLPGSEWSLEGITWSPFPEPLAGTEPYEERDENGRIARSSGEALVRTIGGAKYLFVASTESFDPEEHADGRKTSKVLSIYRLIGERAVPTGSVRVTGYCDWNEQSAMRTACGSDASCVCNPDSTLPLGTVDSGKVQVLSIWNDDDDEGNGNGIADEPLLQGLGPESFSESSNQFWTEAMRQDPPPPGQFVSFDVDSTGDLWLLLGADGFEDMGGGNVEFRRAGIWRVPRDTSSSTLAYELPSSSDRKSHRLDTLGISLGHLLGEPALRFHRDPNESMYLFSPAHMEVYRVDDFLSTQRALALTIELPQPPPSSAVVRSEFNGPSGYKAFDVAGDKAFVSEYQAGVVHVFDAVTGNRITKLFANADVGGYQNHTDFGVKAFKRANGEYLVIEGDTGGRATMHLFRWKPAGCEDDTQCAGLNEYCDAGVCRPRSCSLSDPFGSMSPMLAGGLSADGIALASNQLSAIVSRKPGTHYELYSATRESLNEPFDDLSSLGVNTGADERAPWLSPDGLRLYFHRPGSSGGTDLFVAERPLLSADFTTASPVAGANSSASDEDAFLLPNEATLFFSSARGESTDLYVASRSGAAYAPEWLDVINSSMYADTRPVATRDGLTLYFGSQRSGVNNDHDGDIWTAVRGSTAADFAAPVNVSLLNTSGIDFPVGLSPDGCALYLASNRETGLGSTSELRVYRAQRQASPSQVTVTVNVVGSGSVGTPFSCTSSGGTCVAQRPFGQSLQVWASDGAYWSGNCAAAGSGGLSQDGDILFTVDGTCTVTFQ